MKEKDTKKIIAIDPGPEQSAYIIWNGNEIEYAHIFANQNLLFELQEYPIILRYHPPLIIEQIKSYGMPVSDTIFETVFWIGRFCQAWKESLFYRIPRILIKQHICHDSRAKDSNIRQALIDRFGGKEKAIGRKLSPGPLYGIKKDLWSALALAITWTELYGQKT